MSKLTGRKLHLDLDGQKTACGRSCANVLWVAASLRDFFGVSERFTRCAVCERRGRVAQAEVDADHAEALELMVEAARLEAVKEYSARRDAEYLGRIAATYVLTGDPLFGWDVEHEADAVQRAYTYARDAACMALKVVGREGACSAYAQGKAQRRQAQHGWRN